MAATNSNAGPLENRRFWSRHANPWSVWTLVLTYPVLILAVYRRDRLLAAGALGFVIANPLVFSPPRDDEAWATRVVLGERVWIERGLLASRETLFTAICVPIYLYTIRAAVERQPVRTAVGTGVSLLVMVVFFGQMVRLYEEHTDLQDDVGDVFHRASDD
ncbi:DUF6653 family protein [Natrononativus amylolyticus]|uniref:DUF6653 family protein n=1 Tax=Natrononativus amylolyticus TaxID=2963434 RepID=UPI0020CE3DE4|nr:DUF6653 family protein [Natrononativus amylolyticus]